MATELTKLRLAEISGVDDPANDTPGWIVAKAAGWKAEVEELRKAVVAGNELLDSPEFDVFLNNAPEEVVKAHETLLGYIGSGLETTDEPEQPVEKRSVLERVRDIFGVEKGAAQPVIGTKGATRESVSRTTPAETSSSVAEGNADESGNPVYESDDQGVDTFDRTTPKDKETLQPVIGDRGATRQTIDRVTPADSSANYDVDYDDQGKDELQDPSESVGGVQDVIGENAATRALADRVTPAEAGDQTDRITSDDPNRDDNLGDDDTNPSPSDVNTPPHPRENPSDYDNTASAADADEPDVQKSADDEIAKAADQLTEAMEIALEPVREAIGAIADRLENVEKSTAGRRGLIEDPVYKSADPDTLGGTLRRVAFGETVVLK